MRLANAEPWISLCSRTKLGRASKVRCHAPASIAASGTGGHLFPALSVAEALPSPWNVRWLGVPDRLETELVPERYGLVTVKAGGLQGRGLRKLFQLIRLLAASRDVRRLIRREHIDAVFTTGGYIAAPAILGARWCGVPVVLHESNAIPGRVTRLLGRHCTRVAVGLDAAVRRIPGCTAVVTGTPCGKVSASATLAGLGANGEGPLLVVMGGSQGALGLNRMVRVLPPSCSARLPSGASHRQQRSGREQHRASRPGGTPLQRRDPGLAATRGSGHQSCRCRKPERTGSGTPTILVPSPRPPIAIRMPTQPVRPPLAQP